MCTFLGADSKLAARVELTRSSDSTAFDQKKKKKKKKKKKAFVDSYGEVKGLGGDAYSVQVEVYASKSTTLALRKDDLEIVISSTAEDSKVRDLIETLLDQL